MMLSEFTQALSSPDWIKLDSCHTAELDKTPPSWWVKGKMLITALAPKHLALLVELPHLHAAYLMPPRADA